MNNELQPMQSNELPPTPTSTMQILESAVRGGITGENVAVVKEIIAMRREEMAFQNKVSFNRAFFRLKQELASIDFYADKEAKNSKGEVAYAYCSETELASKLEPILFKHGFAMMFGQRQEDERVVVEVTIVHEEGHEEKREYSVRKGSTNAMKDATAADTGSTTSAWRHLVIKLFGLKSRIKDGDDPRNLGEPITWEQAAYIEELLKETGSDRAKFLQFAGAESVESIMSSNYDRCVTALNKKRK